MFTDFTYCSQHYACFMLMALQTNNIIDIIMVSYLYIRIFNKVAIFSKIFTKDKIFDCGFNL